MSMEGEEWWDEEEEEEVKWAGPYSSMHEILLVGEGDFSFSLSLATSFGSASNIVATSLDPYDMLVAKYSKAKSNLENLEMMGALLLHGKDATKLKLYTDLNMRKFDRIVFNFPHAGFKGREDNAHLIDMHRKLVSGFFKNASHMLRPYGEVHVSHKTKVPFCHWNLEELASKNSLSLIETVDFNINDYPGYNNKRGDGSRCDQPFYLGKCSTFKFRVAETSKKKPTNKYELARSVIPRIQVGETTRQEPFLDSGNFGDRCKIFGARFVPETIYPPPRVMASSSGFVHYSLSGLQHCNSGSPSTLRRHPPLYTDQIIFEQQLERSFNMGHAGMQLHREPLAASRKECQRLLPLTLPPLREAIDHGYPPYLIF